MTSAAASIQEAFREAHLAHPTDGIFDKLAAYLELLTQWNGRLSLTSIRKPSEMIRRHLVECALLAQWLPHDIESLMDYGSGAGFPGLVVAICRPEIAVTLAEAHGKKASFLREVARTLDLTSTNCNIYEGRVEAMPLERSFQIVTMRAVEKMELAIPIAIRHVERSLVILTTDVVAAGYKEKFSDLDWEWDMRLPNSEHGVLALAVPRGTSRGQ